MAHGKEAILGALRDAGGNVTTAAQKLGIARRTLQSRMRFFSIPKGRSGRRKMRITYRKRRMAYTIGAVAAGALVGVVVFKGRGT